MIMDIIMSNQSLNLNTPSRSPWKWRTKTFTGTVYANNREHAEKIAKQRMNDMKVKEEIISLEISQPISKKL